MRDHRGSRGAKETKVFLDFPTPPTRMNCESPNRAPKGLGRGNDEAQIGSGRGARGSLLVTAVCKAPKRAGRHKRILPLRATSGALGRASERLTPSPDTPQVARMEVYPGTPPTPPSGGVSLLGCACLRGACQFVTEQICRWTERRSSAVASALAPDLPSHTPGREIRPRSWCPLRPGTYADKRSSGAAGNSLPVNHRCARLWASPRSLLGWPFILLCRAPR